MIHEMWSAISPTDLGLKAGYWTGKEQDPLTFRPIVGWISVVHNEAGSSSPPKNGFHAVVIRDNMWPVLAQFIDDWCGVFHKGMSEADAKKAAAEWKKPGEAATLQPNVTGTGLA
jgi:hypothetical protein